MTNFTAIQSVSGTLTASTATAITFGSPITAGIPIRYSYIAITNDTFGASTEPAIFARADGIVAVAGADGTVAVYPGETKTISNGLTNWTQAANVIPAGTVTISQGTPAEVQPYGSSLYGGKTSPGTSVSIIGAGATTPSYTVSGVG